MEEKKKSNIFIIIKGVVVAYIITMILISIYSALLAYTSLPESTMPTIVVAIAIVSVMTSSAIVVRKINEKGLINGGILGLTYILTLYILSSILSATFALTGLSITMILMSILAGIIGGIVGVNM